MAERSRGRTCTVDEADGDGEEEVDKILSSERISVSKRNRSPSNDF